MLTRKKLMYWLHYNWHTGIFTWKQKPNRRIKIGSIAGTIFNNGTGQFYITIGIEGIKYLAHRLAILYCTGKLPDYEIDHINHDGTINAMLNLRYASSQINSENMSIFSNNKSGITGVCFDNTRLMWRVSISDNKNRIDLGYHTDFFEACCKRKSAERKYNYHNNHGSIVQ